MNNTGQYTATLRPVIELQDSPIPWRRLWEIVKSELTRHGFAAATVRMYWTVLRHFAADQRGSPRRVTAAALQAYIWDLTDTRASWSWIATNICVLRAVFDKLGGMNIASKLVTPKRPLRLPEILNASEVQALFTAAIRPRDRLLLALIYGCGLRTREACGLKWQDIDTTAKVISIPASYHVKARRLALPPELCAALAAGKRMSGPSPYVFTGNRPDRPLSTRTLQQAIRDISRKAGIGKPVCAMALRHTYAVHIMELGANIREVQVQLGHARIDTTLIYQKCFLPQNARSPLDNLRPPPSPSAPPPIQVSGLIPPPSPSAPPPVQVSGLIPPPSPSAPPPVQVSGLIPPPSLPASPSSPPLPPLFDGPPDNPGIVFPLQFDETLIDKACAFYERLKARITRRLLGTG